jgi:exonuclease III
LAIAEHGLKEDEITQCAIEGYTVATQFCRKEHKGGGMAIYSSRNVTQHKPLKWVTKKSRENTIGVTGIELTCKKKKVIISALHRPPSGGIYEFFTQLTDILEKLAQKDQYIVLVGDFNINTQQGGSSYKQLLDVTEAYNLTVTINIPTQ